MIQKRLFSGLDCLPGQLDLFPMDGEPEREEDAASAEGTHGRIPRDTHDNVEVAVSNKLRRNAR